MNIQGLIKYRTFAQLICVILCAVTTLAHPCHAQTPRPQKTNSSSSTELVYVIALHGNVGKIPGDNDPAFTADYLQSALDAAAKAKATVVVLDIEGPGGLVTEMQAMVKVLLDAQVSGTRIVALPRDAFSAWSIVSLACKEIVVTPTTRMGAAVSIKRQGNGFVEAPDGKDAVSQKFAAPFNALWRQVTDLTGRSPCIAEAMRTQTNELWWSPSKGFADKKGAESDWQQLDDGVAVLCLTGAEMLKTKIAIGEVKSQDELPLLLHCAPGTQIKVASSASVAMAKNTPSGKKQDETNRKIIAKIREAWSLTSIDFRKKTVTRTRPAPSDGMFNNNKVEEYEDIESDAERSTRIQRDLTKVQQRLPHPSQKDCDPDIFEGLEEIRTTLKEATNALRGNSFDAAWERLGQARKVMSIFTGTDGAMDPKLHPSALGHSK